MKQDGCWLKLVMRGSSGVDCTVPDDFDLERLDWIRQAAVL